MIVSNRGTETKTYRHSTMVVVIKYRFILIGFQVEINYPRPSGDSANPLGIRR